MLRTSRSKYIHLIKRNVRHNLFCSSSIRHGHPNVPLALDPSLQALLKTDMSLLSHEVRPPPAPRELEVLPLRPDLGATADTSAQEDDDEISSHRKSPAALFGSQQEGSVIIPLQLQASILRLISESDKKQLHSDAKRLFKNDTATGREEDWSIGYDEHYRSHSQTARHGERDGTAFMSVALPAQYSAIYTVFQHLKRRLGADWKPQHIIDWGADTGSGLWASLYSFQIPPAASQSSDPQHLEASNSSVQSYLGLDKRQGFVEVGKRLWSYVDVRNVKVTWKKSFQALDKMRAPDARTTVALSAFSLSTLPSDLARRAMVHDMWESGTDVMVIIDHCTAAGFKAIVDARKFLLKIANEEPNSDGSEGAHVVAPCPHDLSCPLENANPKFLCSFSQRIQRPSFVRLTKHSSKGHEDVGYSYVVIRRGLRPTINSNLPLVGRVGEVGMREQEKQRISETQVKELQLHTETSKQNLSVGLRSEKSPDVDRVVGLLIDQKELVATLRAEAYHWPRLVFPPLKRSGHIILDGCTSEGKLMRMTIPKSQGKQAFYDARKSSWGDIFPHSPKNPPQERVIRRAKTSSLSMDKRHEPRDIHSGGKSVSRDQKRASKHKKRLYKEIKAWDQKQ